MRFQVPQNIDIEDKIVLGLSFKQLLYVGGGVGIVATLFLLTNIFLAIVVGGPFLLLGVSLAFFRVNSQPFIVILQSFISFAINKKIYTWEKESQEEVMPTVLSKRATQNSQSKEDKVRDLDNKISF